MTTKYEPFIKVLNKRKSHSITVTFGDIEKAVGFELPPTARRFRSWWSNNPRNSVLTQAWVDAGYKTVDVDMVEEHLTFLRQ